jgi:hypothetical protein
MSTSTSHPWKIQKEPARSGFSVSARRRKAGSPSTSGHADAVAEVREGGLDAGPRRRVQRARERSQGRRSSRPALPPKGPRDLRRSGRGDSPPHAPSTLVHKKTTTTRS